MPPIKPSVFNEKDYELPPLEYQEYPFSEKYFSQTLLPYKEGKARLVSNMSIFFL